jgi:anti-sigma factor ChrR (cupin superfamily)
MNPPTLQVRADMSRREVVVFDEVPWVPSPAAGVDRRMLDRVGDEVARATSVVRYAPGSTFDAHEHALGEEFFVLEGVFADEHGSYPAGTYVRNPPGSRHAPRTDAGCTIFVKLRQFAMSDTHRVVVDTTARSFSPGQVDGLTVLPLHEHEGVSTALVGWAPGCQFVAHQHRGGEEIVVLGGTFADEHGSYAAGTWIRSPHLSQHHPFSTEGCLIYVKTGHMTRGGQAS